MMTEKLAITAVVLTFNEEVNIDSCLESVSKCCQQIIIVDSGSTDKTLEICKKYTNVIINHPYIDHVTQWEWVLKNVPIKTEWIMPLDADHVYSAELVKEIKRELPNCPSNINGFYSRHKIVFWGTPLRGFKEYGLRLFRQGKVRLDYTELVDFRFVVEGETRILSGIVFEDNKKESSIDFWIDKHQKFSSRMAVEEVLRREGYLSWSFKPNLFGNPDERIVGFKNMWYHSPLFIRPFAYFAYRYFFRLGILDGISGLVYHTLQAFWFRLIVDIKIYEINKKISEGQLKANSLKESFAHIF